MTHAETAVLKTKTADDSVREERSKTNRTTNIHSVMAVRWQRLNLGVAIHIQEEWGILRYVMIFYRSDRTA